MPYDTRCLSICMCVLVLRLLLKAFFPADRASHVSGAVVVLGKRSCDELQVQRHPMKPQSFFLLLFFRGRTGSICKNYLTGAALKQKTKTQEVRV